VPAADLEHVTGSQSPRHLNGSGIEPGTALVVRRDCTWAPAATAAVGAWRCLIRGSLTWRWWGLGPRAHPGPTLGWDVSALRDLRTQPRCGRDPGHRCRGLTDLRVGPFHLLADAVGFRRVSLAVFQGRDAGHIMFFNRIGKRGRKKYLADSTP